MALLMVCLFTGYVQLFSQTYFFDNYSVAEGLEQSKVYSIVQDDRQFVWLGTKAGVSKFDGINFTNYTVENGLAPSGVRVLFIDNYKTIWMGHEGGGITRIYKGKIERLRSLDTLIKSNITSIIQDAENQLWITTEKDGAIVIKNPLSTQSQIKYEQYLQGKSLGDQVFSSLAASDGNLYFMTNAGIRKYDKNKKTFENYAPDGMFTYFLTTVMFEDKQGNFWFGTYNGGLHKLNKATKKFEFFDTKSGLATNWVSCITQDHLGNIWVGHWDNDKNYGGISRISPSGEIKVFNTADGLHDNQIWCIKEDVEGNILVGTTEHGLDIFKGEQFETYTTSEGLINNQVWAVLQDKKGRIWFGTNDGITVFSDAGKNKSVVNYNQSRNFISNQIRFLKQDRDNNIWIGTADQGVMFYSLNQERFISQPLINSYFPSQKVAMEIRALEIDQQAHLWYGTLDGLIEYDIHKNEMVKTHSQETGLAGNDISALFADSRNNIWVGSRGKGLTKIHDGKEEIIKGIGEITPTCITEDQEGKIWIGTESKGVLVLENNSVKHFGPEEGLLANLINLITIDKNMDVYVGTNRGLNKIDQKTGKIYTYTKHAGFTGIETKSNAVCKDNEGFIWFGTVDGAIRCNPTLLNKVPGEPVVHITELQVNGSVSGMENGLRLPSYKNDIAFKFSSVCLSNPEGLVYQVILDGLHDKWLNEKGENFILFNKLQPGRYVFKVRARIDEGPWTSNPATFSFRILAPFYKRGYFITGVIILILIAIALFIKIRERNLRNEKKVLEERVNERTLALSKANEELSARNKDITDSITYAKRIQLAILPSDIPFENTFILFKPKDIVSGDFYWMNTSGGKEFMAAVDCTGHGVPGAFMSFIGYTSLNKIIIEQGIHQPSDILNKLNKEVSATLHQKGEDIVNDGMDLALICYTPGTGQLEYAGAFNSLIIVRTGELIEIKADRFAIGRSTGKEKSFTNHQIELEKDDALFMFSDGYADQFGGPEGKKFKTTNLKDLLISVSNYPVEKQRAVLDRTFEEWKGNFEQIDDMLIVGRKFVLKP